jgi:lipid-A-disaccharide synthase
LPEAPRLFLSAGDTSGDQHAARLLRRLRELCPGLSAEGLGGPELAAAGCALHEDLVRHAIFGLSGALRAVPHMLGVLRRAAGVLDARRPDAVVLVDYPGLNLFVARLAAARGIPVVYFVAPQLWAWAPWRARRFARVVDEALVIFPFEVTFWRGAGVPATYVGHPLLDGLPHDEAGLAARRDPAIAALPRPVALLPGSRPREVRQNMPTFLAAARRLLERHPDTSFHSAHVAPHERDNLARHAAAAGVPLTVHADRVHAVMASCRAALVASGTATLETALLGTPLVVAYHVSPTEQRIGRLLVLPPWIGQVNLVAGREVTPELVLVNGDPTAGERLAQAALPLLSDSPEWRAQRVAFEALRERTSGPGAVERAARHLAARLRAGAAASAAG